MCLVQKCKVNCTVYIICDLNMNELNLAILKSVKFLCCHFELPGHFINIPNFCYPKCFNSKVIKKTSFLYLFNHISGVFFFKYMLLFL